MRSKLGEKEIPLENRAQFRKFPKTCELFKIFFGYLFNCYKNGRSNSITVIEVNFFSLNHARLYGVYGWLLLVGKGLQVKVTSFLAVN